jgi:hypothetical protein
MHETDRYVQRRRARADERCDRYTGGIAMHSCASLAEEAT